MNRGAYLPLLFIILALGALIGGIASAVAQDAAHGREVFRKCAACHAVEPNAKKVGPSLYGVLGRASGTLPGFDYSTGMRDAAVLWDEKTLDQYLTKPRDFVPGNKMIFAGLSAEKDRADVIAYIRSLTPAAGQTAQNAAPTTPAAPGPTTAPPAQQAGTPPASSYEGQVKYTLRSGIAEGRMVYIGVGGDIDGQVNPDLKAAIGDSVLVTVINGEGAEHDIFFPDQNAKSPRVVGRGASTSIAFNVTKAGSFAYYCTVAGHRAAGMEGKLVVVEKREAPQISRPNIARDPADLPGPIAKRGPMNLKIELETVELEGQLADGTTFTYWTFNRAVPGPFLRARVGDTIEVHLKNDHDSAMIHSVDFHATTGPGGGAAALQVDPGDSKWIKFKALQPGLYVYHCATPMVAQHIANGMYGMILIEPEGGLPKVDHEFYVMQGEVYTEGAFGQKGSQEFSVRKLLDERPEYVVFNGAVGSLTAAHPLHAKVGETVRIFFGVGGPNLTSSFHVIGEIFDQVYPYGSVTSPTIKDVQTVTVAPGGATIVEFKLNYPGRYLLVDHALSRLERGLVGFLIVDGPADKSIFEAGSPMTGGGH
jgi:nitrite reductase (NO-forming)